MHRPCGGDHVIIIPFIVVAALGAAVLDDRHTGWTRLLKMSASTGVLMLVFILAPEASTYLALIVIGLAASWVGDLALTFGGRSPFVVGLIAFAGAHVAYTAAFVSRSALDPTAVVITGVVMAIFALVVLRWLAPHRPAELRIPITFYVVIISIMVTAAFGTHGTVPDVRIPLGAVLFAASDLFVARQRFVTSAPVNRVVGLPLYFASQILFATTP